MGRYILHRENVDHGDSAYVSEPALQEGIVGSGRSARQDGQVPALPDEFPGSGTEEDRQRYAHLIAAAGSPRGVVQRGDPDI
jgi:hypothetical protein